MSLFDFLTKENMATVKRFVMDLKSVHNIYINTVIYYIPYRNSEHNIADSLTNIEIEYMFIAVSNV